MTLQLRPTFSESWYRVANLRAKLRPGAQISRQFYRGERWYVVRDPAGNQYHRLSDAAYRFVGLLDGTRTVEEAWELVGGTLEDDAPTQPEVIQILSHLYSANLIDADVTPDATVLLRRHKQLTKRKLQGRLMNVLFPRIPLWDPDAFLKRWMPLAKVVFSKFGALVWLAVVISACVMLVPFWDMPNHSLKNAALYSINLRDNAINVLLLWFVFCAIKFIHELGHAFSCRRFGGECHEMGIMFLVFIPTPYVDASSAWSFANKWHRIFVGAAGMIVELFVAGLCAFIWMHFNPRSLPGQLSFNAMLVASVTTVIFNANPLLRYDGYYILSDFWEIPNLSQKSSEYALGLIKRHIFRVKLQQPLPPPLQRVWLLIYAILSSIYRAFVGIMIIFLVAFQIPILGILMAIGGVITWVTVPVFKIFKYLTIEPELHRKRGRAIAFTLAVAGAIVALIGFVPFSVDIDQPAYADAFINEPVRPQWSAWVQSVAHLNGDWVKKGEVLLVTRDPELDMKIEQAQANVRLYEDRKAAEQAVDPAAALIDNEALIGARKQLDLLMDQKSRLTIRAAATGQLVAPTLQDRASVMNRFFQQGELIGSVINDATLNLRTLLPQDDSEVVTKGLQGKTQPRVLVRLVSDMKTVLTGGKPHLYTAATDKPIHEGVITSMTGEEAPLNPRDPTKLEHDEFEVDVPLNNPVVTDSSGNPVLGPEGRPQHKYVPGQKAYVRFKLGKEPLYWQWGRKLLQIIQERPASPLTDVK